MFCPKCGSQNADETKFCRGCGADVSNVLSVVSPATPDVRQATSGRSGATAPIATSLAEQEIELWSRGWRGMIGGLGFLIVSGLGFGLSQRTWVMGFFGLIFAIVFLAMGISRFIQARALRRLREGGSLENPMALSSGQMDYIQPSHSLFDTDDLSGEPRSITEHTTTRLELGRDAENK